MSGTESRKRVSPATRVVCTLAFLTWVFLPVSLVMSIWSGDWRWLTTGVVLAAAGLLFAALVLSAERQPR